MKGINFWFRINDYITITERGTALNKIDIVPVRPCGHWCQFLGVVQRLVKKLVMTQAKMADLFFLQAISADVIHPKKRFQDG